MKNEIRKMTPSVADVVRNADPGGKSGAMSNKPNIRVNNSDLNHVNNDKLDAAPEARNEVKEVLLTYKLIYSSNTSLITITEHRSGYSILENLNPRRGFLGRKTQTHGQGQRRGSWRSDLPRVTGASNNKEFSAPVDLFVSNVNKEVTGDTITDFMRSSKNLELIECEKVGHKEARNM